MLPDDVENRLLGMTGGNPFEPVEGTVDALGAMRREPSAAPKKRKYVTAEMICNAPRTMAAIATRARTRDQRSRFAGELAKRRTSRTASASSARLHPPSARPDATQQIREKGCVLRRRSASIAPTSSRTLQTPGTWSWSAPKCVARAVQTR